MPKHKKLKMEDLKVLSFVTAMRKKHTKTAKGGTDICAPPTWGCPSGPTCYHPDNIWGCNPGGGGGPDTNKTCPFNL